MATGFWKRAHNFLGSGFWPQAIEAGWTLPEIFGVDPSAPLGGPELWGLVPRLAWSSRSYSRLMSITPEAAEFLTAQGSPLVEYRFSAGALSSRATVAIEWWRCSFLIGEQELLVV